MNNLNVFKATKMDSRRKPPTCFSSLIVNFEHIPFIHFRSLLPVNIYLFKVNNRNSRKRYEIVGVGVEPVVGAFQ